MPPLSPDRPVAGRRDRTYWRALAADYDAAGLVPDPGPEFPPGADEPPTGVSRRGFMKLLGASMALAGVSGCVERPTEWIVPYVRRPPEIEPGTPLAYATTMPMEGYGTGLVVQTREGRPIKVEGNPQHPASLGSAGVFEQASVLGLYDPDRFKGIRGPSGPASWNRVVQRFGEAREDRGERLRFLLEPTSSALRGHLIERVRERHPRARFTFHSATSPVGLIEATRRLLGRPLIPRYDFARAEVVVALDADFLATGPFCLHHARQFAKTRRIDHPEAPMSRLYAADAAPTPTSAFADHRLRAKPSELPRIAAALLARLGGAAAATVPRDPFEELPEAARHWVEYAARDLREHAGRAIVLAGESAPAAVHAAAIVANQALGTLGGTVRFAESPVLEWGEATHEVARLAGEIEQGGVDTLAILEGNPVYASPGDVPLRALLRELDTTLYLGLHDNETAEAAGWFVGGTHYMEMWGDTRAYDGTLSPIQPLIRPLYDGHTADELLAAFAGMGDRTAHDLLRGFWRGRVLPEPDFEHAWHEALKRGVVPGTELPAMTVSPDFAAARPLFEEALRAAAPARLEAALQADPSVWDGEFGNNAWLQELPDPVTKQAWGNAALIAADTASRLALSSGDVVQLTYDGRSVRAPVLIVPGHAEATLTLRLGYGRWGGVETARGVGFDAYRLRSWRHPWQLPEVSVEPVPGERAQLALTQTHWSMQGRPIALQETLHYYREHPHFTEPHKGPVPSLYHGPVLEGEHQWAMTIDLALCTGCSACVVACQAENNVPVVGEEGVRMGREMHWLRVDRYMTGSVEDPSFVHQPMLCQHCEKAPCEYVCPVFATTHSEDGLNEMIYNRCIGTRFCSNNCPYKVRRFNWFDYNEGRRTPEGLVLNPDVTVRERGVMEKCTYCVQRIRRRQIQAELEGHPLMDGAVETACQQTCPTKAILFGSIADPDTEVSKSREQHRIYSVLHELGTEPRTKYLARITNPNPELEALEERRAPRDPGPGERV